MYSDVYKKYVNNFKTILPFILVKMSADLFNYLVNGGVETAGKYDMIFGGSSIIRSIRFPVIAIYLFLFLTSPILYAFMALLCKKILKDEEDVNLGETLKESIHYYFRYIGLSLIIIAVMIGIALLLMITGGIFFLIIPVILFLLYFGITVEPCSEYLIYNDSSAEEAFSGGRRIGKKYFWEILGVNIIIGVIGWVFKANFFLEIPGLLIASLITSTLQGYFIMFKINLCSLDSN